MPIGAVQHELGDDRLYAIARRPTIVTVTVQDMDGPRILIVPGSVRLDFKA